MNPPDLLSLNPFHRLGTLLDHLPPGPSPLPDGRPLSLAIGDPRTPMPELGHAALAEAASGWSRYAGAKGHPDYLEAAAAWLARRYALPPGFVTAERHVMPVSGSREGIFFAVLMAVAEKRAALGGQQPVVLLPDPGYHAYVGAAMAAGAELAFVPATAASGDLPHFAALPESQLGRAALAFLCSPANPQGAVASPEHLAESLALARRHGFVLAVDECYSELYTGTPPAGGLAAAAATGSLDNLLVLHSLSKRSGAPGLRCGFVAGAPALISRLEGYLRFGGAGLPLPVLAAGTALWREESHAAANRTYYNRNLELAERLLGNAFGWRKPAGGFFLWLDVTAGRSPDGETAALALWQEGGIRVLPGAYLSLAERPAEDNPGRRFIRVALVEEAQLMERALTRLREILL